MQMIHHQALAQQHSQDGSQSRTNSGGNEVDGVQFQVVSESSGGDNSGGNNNNIEIKDEVKLEDKDNRPIVTIPT